MSVERRAIVTGGSRGIGRAIVERLAADGFGVVLTFRQNERAACEVAEGARARGHAVFVERHDQEDVTEISALFARAASCFRTTDDAFLDVLVINAGLMEHESIAEVTPESFDRVMAVNTRGPFFMLQHAAKRMREGGRIVLVSSICTELPSPGEAVCAASKAALEQFARVASRELGRRGVTVNSVSPGPTDTDLLRGSTTEEEREAFARATALRRIGRPEDVAGVVSLLARPESGWLTGQNLRADGGLV